MNIETILSGVLVVLLVLMVKLALSYKRKLDEYLILVQQYTHIKATYDLAQKHIEELSASIKESHVLAEQLRSQAFNAQTQLELKAQQLSNQEKHAQQWKEDQAGHLELTKASILQAGAQMSNKLLDDHKREQQNSQKVNEERIKQTTETLHQQFKHVFESMHHLHKKMGKMESIERALLSPQGAGALAEITLENMFKSSGLVSDVDYVMQHYIEKQNGGSAKPDAVVFLPGEHMMVIDCKASKFFMEMDQENKDAAQQSLKQTMNMHIKDLIKRDYKEALAEQIERKQLAGQAPNIVVMMFLPTEAALETVRRADPNFEEKAWQHQIIPVGPSGLMNALMQAKMMIFSAKQDEHSALIMAEVKKLLASISTMNHLSEGLGKSIKSAFDKYDKFAASFNGNFLSKAKRIHDYGIALPGDKDLKKLDRYQVVSTTELIEAENEEEVG